MSSRGWLIARKYHLPALRKFVVEHEEWCVPFAETLSSRRSPAGTRLLFYSDGVHILAAVHISPSGVILPVLSESYLIRYADTPIPAQLLPKNPFSFLGNARWVDFVNRGYGTFTGKTIHYLLMVHPGGELPRPDYPSGIRVVRMDKKTSPLLFPLQRGYELEEVMLDPGTFNRRVCRANLERLLVRHHVFAALNVDGIPLAKANTNALGITCDQVGGVYTLPDQRGRGLAFMVMTELLRDIFFRRRKACLFVKRDNRTAVDLYRRCGFYPRGEFVIFYPGRGE